MEGLLRHLLDKGAKDYCHKGNKASLLPHDVLCKTASLVTSIPIAIAERGLNPEAFIDVSYRRHDKDKLVSVFECFFWFKKAKDFTLSCR
jgi:hypothetical protein